MSRGIATASALGRRSLSGYFLRGSCAVKPRRAFDDGVGRTYIIYYFAPAVIIIRFKTLNNHKNQLLTRNFSTTFFTEEFRNNRPSPAILSGRLTSLEEDDDVVCPTSFLRNGAASA